jgi:MoaA/NifB/PqqE/SkfB family radical SAM enzyme
MGGNGGARGERGLLSKGKALIEQVKQRSFEYGLSQIFAFLAKSSDKNYLRLVWLMEKYMNSPQQQATIQWLRHYVSPGQPGAAYLNRVLGSLHPNVRRRYLAGFIGNLLFRGTDNIAIQERTQNEMGCSPKLVVISPTDACNYRCVGCYADGYGRFYHLPEELVQRVITECKELGVRFFVISGGEPFLWKPLLSIFERNLDCTFQVYTNGSKIDRQMARELVRLGNVCPCISVEGFEEETDARRGKGAWETAVNAWRNLREAGCVYGFSATATSKNYLVITSEEFFDEMIRHNVHYGWYFIYIPTGANPDMSLFLTPEQRNEFRARIVRMRSTKPLLAGDFWNDGCLTDGCLAGGRHYFHINAKGDVEPCVFSHFTVDSIYEKSVREVLSSPFFRELRERTEFETRGNRLAPCSIIDHPYVLRETVNKYHARPSHKGAETIITTLSPVLERYGEEYERLTQPIFEKEYLPWYEVFQGKVKEREVVAEKVRERTRA